MPGSGALEGGQTSEVASRKKSDWVAVDPPAKSLFLVGLVENPT